MTAATRAAHVLAITALVHLALSFAPGCAGPGYEGCVSPTLISVELLHGGLFVATVDADQESIWRSMGRVLKRAGAQSIDAREKGQIARAMIDGTRVTIRVEPDYSDFTSMRVFAVDGSGIREATARDLLFRIVDEIDAERYR